VEGRRGRRAGPAVPRRVLAVSELAFLSAREALQLFSARELSPVELMTAVLERVEETDLDINAFSARYPDAALDGARSAERRYRRGGPEVRPLDGLPVAIKELTPVAGQQHTLGSLALADNVATETAPAAARVIEAGGIVHGRTTTPEFGCASYTHSRLYGMTRNPWNPEYSPAGSSGGAAAALATGATALAQGTDSAGSLRLPAASCGVVGYKPPAGRVPGLAPLNLEPCNHDGPMARSVDDCALLYRVMAQPDLIADPATARPPLELPTELDGVEGFRIAMLAGIGGLDVDADVAANVRAAGSALGDAGAVLEEIDLGWDYDRIIRATKLHFAATYGPMVQRVTDAFPDLVTSYAADFARQELRVHRETPGFLLQANELTAELWAPLADLFRRADALLLPTLAIPAPRAGEEFLDSGPVIDGVEQPDRWTVGFTVPFNLCNWCPAMSVPSGLGRDGLPTGVQIVGRPYDDLSVFRVGKTLEQASPWLDGQGRWPGPQRRQPERSER
jgi:Asp-tRNA(Asn)/Glu-tRNA(Gln) amidotransferase A subunit family amidase